MIATKSHLPVLVILLNGEVIDTRNVANIDDVITIDLNYEEDNYNM